MIKRHNPFSMFLSLVFFVFTVVFTASCLLGVLGYFLYRVTSIPNKMSPHLVWVCCLVCSVATCTLITVCFGRRALSSVLDLNHAMQEVGKGHFDVRINKKQRMAEMVGIAEVFNKMADELGNKEMLRNDFVTNISHEFKTPLSIIEGYSTLLEDDTLTQKERLEYLNAIKDSTRRLSEMTSMILKLSKLENQTFAMDKQTFRLDEQLRETLVNLEPKWSEKDIDLEIDLEKRKYIADENMLRHVWNNLLDNAIKFSPQGGKITVKMYQQDLKIIVKIQDEGIGMSQDEQRHIFEKFYQADQSRSGEGNGLGLALASQIIATCKGTIEVESEPHKGSLFTVKLPLES